MACASPRCARGSARAGPPRHPAGARPGPDRLRLWCTRTRRRSGACCARSRTSSKVEDGRRWLRDRTMATDENETTRRSGSTTSRRAGLPRARKRVGRGIGRAPARRPAAARRARSPLRPHGMRAGFRAARCRCTCSRASCAAPHERCRCRWARSAPTRRRQRGRPRAVFEAGAEVTPEALLAAGPRCATLKPPGQDPRRRRARPRR